MKTKLITTILIATCLSIPVTAEVQTYEDDYVKFQYDDSVPCHIRVVKTTKNIGFVIDTAVTSKEDNWAVVAMSKGEDEPDRLMHSEDKKLDGYDACKLFLDSFEVKTDSLIDAEYDGHTYNLILNDCYSEQALKYLERALEICNDYLDRKISGADAADQIKELEKRAESYSDTSDYTFDSDAKTILTSEDYYFKFGKDSDVIDLKKELERVLA